MFVCQRVNDYAVGRDIVYISGSHKNTQKDNALFPTLASATCLDRSDHTITYPYSKVRKIQCRDCRCKKTHLAYPRVRDT